MRRGRCTVTTCQASMGLRTASRALEKQMSTSRCLTMLAPAHRLPGLPPELGFKGPTRPIANPCTFLRASRPPSIAGFPAPQKMNDRRQCKGLPSVHVPREVL